MNIAKIVPRPWANHWSLGEVRSKNPTRKSPVRSEDVICGSAGMKGQRTCSLTGPYTGERAPEKVHVLGFWDGPPMAFGSCADDDLGGFGCCCERSDI